ncbi:hypothetical protein [Arthrobacter sp. FW306-04-A]|uniref:hypothetical protein n=1 Tax=Arthrobacter sp. FW306-04-A TaxID=2879619 RepID=UPI0037BF7016|nr:hypothetical protein LFT43_09050 [Arthrobacter sp. FW306-04-A]
MKRLSAALALGSLLAVVPMAGATAAEDPYYIKIGQTADITAASTQQITHLAMPITYRCPVGATGFLDVVVNQGATQGFGGNYVTCTGGDVRETVDVQSNFGGPAFTPGQASVNVFLVGSPQNFYTSDQVKIR